MTTTSDMIVRRPVFAPDMAVKATAAEVAEARPAWPTRGDARHVYVEEFDAVFAWDALSEADADGYTILGHAQAATLPGRWNLVGDRITLSPRGGGLDDWPRVMAACAALAYRGEIHLRTGAWLCKSNQVTPSGTRLTFAPGCTLACSLTPLGIGGAFAASPFWNGGGTEVANTTTLADDADIGDVEIEVASAAGLSVGDIINLRHSDAWIRQRKIIAIDGTTVRIDEPLLRPHYIGDGVAVVDGTLDVVVIGNGLEITGTGDAAFELISAWRCYVEGINVSGTGWGIYQFAFDVAARDCWWVRCNADGGNIVLGGFAHDFGERTHMIDCNSRRFVHSNVTHCSTDDCSVTRGNITEQVRNIADSGALQIDVVAGAGTFTRASGSFVDDGFKVGHSVTFSGFANGGNNATKTITAVTALVITVGDTSGLVNETGSGNERVQGAVIAGSAGWLISVVNTSDTLGSRGTRGIDVNLKKGDQPGVLAQLNSIVTLIGVDVAAFQSGVAVSNGAKVTMLGGRSHDNTVAAVVAAADGAGKSYGTEIEGDILEAGGTWTDN